MRRDSHRGTMELVKGEERSERAHPGYVQHESRKRGPVNQGGAYRRNYGLNTGRSTARSSVFHGRRWHARWVLSSRYGRCFPDTYYYGTSVPAIRCNGSYAARDDPGRPAGSGRGSTRASGTKVRLEPSEQQGEGRGCGSAFSLSHWFPRPSLNRQLNFRELLSPEARFPRRFLSAIR